MAEFTAPKRYWSDTHFHHERILIHQPRPWRDVARMDEALMEAFWEAASAGFAIYHMGDFAWQPLHLREVYGGVPYPERHTLIAGNHDKGLLYPGEVLDAVHAWFGTVVGSKETWKENTLLVEDTLEGREVKLLLSHAPQQDLQGADYNLYGHVHANPANEPERFAEEYPWLASGSERHFNVSVEVIGYRPVSLAEIFEMRAAGTGV